jgi:3-dehydroquinate synthase
MNEVLIRPASPLPSTTLYIGRGLLQGALLQECCRTLAERAVLVADETLKSTYANALARHVRAELLTIPSGEQAKTWERHAQLTDALCRLGCGRDTVLIALGGGAATDLVGFTASVYLRGVPLILIPTTLLGMVDAAIGGKTALNTSQGKNLIGTIYHPKAIVADLDTLQTLPKREWDNGLAEILKIGLTQDSSIWEMAEKNGRDPALILKAIQGKVAVIEQDPEERGIRRVLNFGHTIGHALEALSHYGIPHGEAVALGCQAEAYVSAHLGYLSQEACTRIHAVYKDFSLRLPKTYTRQGLLEALLHDKKRAQGKTRIVLIDRIGHALPFAGAYCRSVTPEDLQTALDWMEATYG